MYVKISNVLSQEIGIAISAGTNCVYKPMLALHNPNTEYAEVFDMMESLNIEQDFTRSYMDKISAVIRIRVDQLRDIIANLQDLECTIMLTPMIMRLNIPDYSQEPIIIKANVISDNTDIDQMYNKEQFNSDHNRPPLNASEQQLTMLYPIYLIEPAVYKARHMGINAILNGVDMEHALQWICYQFGFESVNIYKPDNPQVYGSVIIPPMKYLSDVFPYLQDRYGIYSSGLGYYVTGNTIYIYPAFDKDPSHSPVEGVIHLIHGPKNNYLGLDSYHTTVETDTWILSVSDVEIKKPGIAAEENDGNTMTVSNPNNAMDSGVVIGKDGSVTRDTSTVTTIQLAGSKSMKTNSNVPKYKGSSSNIYKLTSDMAASEYDYIGLVWLQSVPRFIKPGQSILYHYDSKDNVYCAQAGRILSASYASVAHKGNNQFQKLFTFTCNLSFFVEPPKPVDNTVAT